MSTIEMASDSQIVDDANDNDLKGVLDELTAFRIFKNGKNSCGVWHEFAPEYPQCDDTDNILACSHGDKGRKRLMEIIRDLEEKGALEPSEAGRLHTIVHDADRELVNLDTAVSVVGDYRAGGNASALVVQQAKSAGIQMPLPIIQSCKLSDLVSCTQVRHEEISHPLAPVLERCKEVIRSRIASIKQS